MRTHIMFVIKGNDNLSHTCGFIDIEYINKHINEENNVIKC